MVSFSGGLYLGYRIKKERIVEKPVVVREEVDYDNPELLDRAINEISEKYNIRKEVFKAIIKCEGGSVFALNTTSDFGLYQINLKTAKQYGAKSLKDIIEPFLSTELVAKIIQKEGLKPWRMTRECIEKELIFKK
ncbi:MAG: transglycosylase SLT domain-containing protein [candidate division WOR-3 bacterium]